MSLHQPDGTADVESSVVGEFTCFRCVGSTILVVRRVVRRVWLSSGRGCSVPKHIGRVPSRAIVTGVSVSVASHHDHETDIGGNGGIDSRDDLVGPWFRENRSSRAVSRQTTTNSVPGAVSTSVVCPSKLVG